MTKLIQLKLGEEEAMTTEFMQCEGENLTLVGTNTENLLVLKNPISVGNTFQLEGGKIRITKDCYCRAVGAVTWSHPSNTSRNIHIKVNGTSRIRTVFNMDGSTNIQSTLTFSSKVLELKANDLVEMTVWGTNSHQISGNLSWVLIEKVI